MLLGVDTGGTFTDFVCFDRGRLRIHKVLSTLGMLVAPRGRQMSRTLRGLLNEQNDAGLQTAFQRLVDQGLGELREEGVQDTAVDSTYSLDLRYAGQSFSLTIPFESVAGGTFLSGSGLASQEGDGWQLAADKKIRRPCDTAEMTG